MNDYDNYFILIKQLPTDILYIIKEFLPISITVFLNKDLYIKNHKIVKRYISKNSYENYIRNMIERDNSFVIQQLMNENFERWYKFKNYLYKNICYYNYIYFLIEFSIINNSIDCMKKLKSHLLNTGLSKNQHKKNAIKSIRWIT
jgi:hypothetical protein